MKRIPAFLTIFALASLVGGCASALPKYEVVQKRPPELSTYEKAREAYDRVVEGKTTLADLEVLGFSASGVSGVEQWDSVTIAKDLLPNSEMNRESVEKAIHLPAQAKACLLAGPNALAVKYNLDYTQIQTEGNLIQEKVGLKKQRRLVGKKVWAWFCYENETKIVLYKRIYDPSPLDEERTEKDPLGIFGNFFLFKLLR